jgi:hypothetical protein
MVELSVRRHMGRWSFPCIEYQNGDDLDIDKDGPCVENVIADNPAWVVRKWITPKIAV